MTIMASTMVPFHYSMRCRKHGIITVAQGYTGVGGDEYLSRNMGTDVHMWLSLGMRHLR